jgi:hypothetical protein
MNLKTGGTNFGVGATNLGIGATNFGVGAANLEVGATLLEVGATNLGIGAALLGVGRRGTKADWTGKIKAMMLEIYENSLNRRLKPSLRRKINELHSYGT